MTERITITRHGNDDYSVSFAVADYSVRGTYADVLTAIREHTTAELLRYSLPHDNERKVSYYG